MTQAPTTNSPVEFAPTGIGELTICVRLMIPPTPILLTICPPGNQVATGVLSYLLEARIQLAGVRVMSRFAGLEFNRAMLIYRVSALGDALTAIKEALAAVELLPWAQIAWADERESVMRMVHPDNGEFQMPSSEERAAEPAFCSVARELLLKLAQARKARPPDSAPGSPDTGGHSPT